MKVNLLKSRILTGHSMALGLDCRVADAMLRRSIPGRGGLR